MTSDGQSGDLGAVLAEIADSDWFKDCLYPDALAPAAREFGAILAEITSAGHILSAPFYALGLIGKRTMTLVRDAIGVVPAEHRTKADPQFTAEVLEGVRCREDGGIRDMFSRLLKTAIDKRRCANAHPAFPGIVAQLCEDEADLLAWMAREGSARYRFLTNDRMSGRPNPENPRDDSPIGLRQPEMLYVYASHLQALDIAEHVDVRRDLSAMNAGVDIAWAPCMLRPNTFGRLLLRACLPDLDDATEGKAAP